MKMLHEVIGLIPILSARSLTVTLAQCLAGWSGELGQAAGDQRPACGRRGATMRACRDLLFTRLGHDVRPQSSLMIWVPLKNLREQLVVDFLGTLRLSHFPVVFFLVPSSSRHYHRWSSFGERHQRQVEEAHPSDVGTATWTET